MFVCVHKQPACLSLARWSCSCSQMAHRLCLYRLDDWYLGKRSRVCNVFDRGTRGIEWMALRQQRILGSRGDLSPICRLFAWIIEQSWRRICPFERRTQRSIRQRSNSSMIQEVCFRLEKQQKMGRREGGREATNPENDLSDRSPPAFLRE